MLLAAFIFLTNGKTKAHQICVTAPVSAAVSGESNNFSISLGFPVLGSPCPVLSGSLRQTQWAKKWPAGLPSAGCCGQMYTDDSCRCWPCSTSGQ